MRRSIGQSLRIDVAGNAVSLLRVSRWSGRGKGKDGAVTLLGEHAFAPSSTHQFDAIANALRALLGEQQVDGWPVAIVLADELTRVWRVAPPPGATRMDDMEAAAGLRFQALYGEPPSAWQIAADWNATEPFFAAAMPRALLAVLMLVAQEHKLAVVGVEPHVVSAWNRWRRGMKRGAWFGLLHDNLLTLAAIGGSGADADNNNDGLRAIRALPVPPGADPAWLTQTVTREALLLDMAPPALLQLCGSGTASPALAAAWTRPASNPALIACEALDLARDTGGASTRAIRIDFAPRGLRRTLFHTHPASLALAGVGLLLCAGAAFGAWKLVEQQRLRDEQMRHVRERVAAMSARPVEVARVVIPEAQAAFVNGAVAQLNLPWRELQDAVAAATPRNVALVSMEPDARKQVLKLTAETKNSDDMVAYVAELKQQETFSGVLLTRHEINEQDPVRPLRFQLEATWIAR